jgi:hypothetical protein
MGGSYEPILSYSTGSLDENTTGKRISVTATIKGIEYTETMIVSGHPGLKVEDVKVEIINEGIAPQIKISLIVE